MSKKVALLIFMFVFLFMFFNLLSVGYCEQPVLSLPFHGGVNYRCTQGVNNSYTHQYTSTKYDLDFDTPNNTDDDVLASADGTAYIFTTNIFGNHINIDHGGGYFTVSGHLKSFAVQNGERVVRGQVIGKEGTTGNSDGDHIHWGLHNGDPKVKAENSTSVLAKFITARDLTINSGFKQMKSDEFIGGLINGHFYESDNRLYPVALTQSNNLNQQIYTAYTRVGGYTRLGAPFDNGGTEYVHNWNGITLQDFQHPDCPNGQCPDPAPRIKRYYGDDGQSAIIYNPTQNSAHLVRDGFWGVYKINNLDRF